MAIPQSYYEQPSFLEFFQRAAISLNELCFKTDKPFDFTFVLSMIQSVKLIDIFTVFCVAFLFTGLRSLMTRFVSVPLANALQVAAEHRPKWPESVWKLLIYSGLWLQSLYVVVLCGKYDFLQNPLDIFKDCVFGDAQLKQAVPSDIYWMYMLQLGFYVHSIIGTLYMDMWRKDSVMMLLHHGLTIFLLEFSFLVRAWFRLYWYPLKVLYTSTWGIYIHHRHNDHKLVLFFNCMLIALQMLHIYWFYFIILLLIRVATGRQSEIEDTREFEEETTKNANNGRPHDD
uniref:TLC domain-containing protein n=1 Tax=Macrostomum lignano TaxID=282301 RepID=A0A1I8J1Z8_9PLAT